jgi:hypothetical protein
VPLGRATVDARDGDLSFALRKFDSTNDFNEISRENILDYVQEKYAGLYKYVKMCYAKTSSL